jgi:hypothetical protein
MPDINARLRYIPLTSSSFALGRQHKMFRFHLTLLNFFVLLILLGLLISPLAYAQQSAGTGSQSKAMPAAAPDSPAPAVLAQKPPTAKLADFGWLEGRWRGDWGPRVAEQVWMAPKAGLMLGVFRLIEGDKPLVIELFSMVQKPDGINFYFRHFTPELVPWEKSEATVLNLTNLDGRKIDFENPVNGMPKRSIFTRIDADTYTSRSELVPETGDTQVIEITYHRQAQVASASNGGSAGHQKKP